MSAVKSGELFAGVAGLSRAIDEVFGAMPAWFAEIDAAPSKVLEYRFPGVPNFGDVSAVDFTTAERVNVLAGGFPCQDVSLAGRRRGLKEGTRSGLWSEFARAIDEIRPDWVVIENVRGLLSADATGDVEPCPWCLADATGEHALRALGAVLGDLAELGFDAEWTGLRAADVGAPHGRFRVFILAWPAENAGRGRGRGRAVASGRGETARADIAPHGADSGDDGAPESSELTLLPTPAAMNPNDGEGTETWLARREQVKAKGVNGNGMGMPLSIAVQLLPTPVTSMTKGGDRTPKERAAAGHAINLQDVAVHGGVESSWGLYEPAIRRWESMIDRPAPAPVRMDGKGGKARLNPELPEWMMGWPKGWVTAPEIGLSRSEQLKAIGNGVCTLQAVYAVRSLLNRPGVPALASLSGEVTA